MNNILLENTILSFSLVHLHSPCPFSKHIPMMQKITKQEWQKDIASILETKFLKLQQQPYNIKLSPLLISSSQYQVSAEIIGFFVYQSLQELFSEIFYSKIHQNKESFELLKSLWASLFSKDKFESLIFS